MSGRRADRDRALSGNLGAIRWAVSQQPDDAIAKLILIVMSVPANKSFECYMSHANIAAAAGCNRRTVMRKIECLLMKGYLEDISAQYPHRPTNTYLLCVAAG